jgi:hypothetical protein
MTVQEVCYLINGILSDIHRWSWGQTNRQSFTDEIRVFIPDVIPDIDYHFSLYFDLVALNVDFLISLRWIKKYWGTKPVVSILILMLILAALLILLLLDSEDIQPWMPYQMRGTDEKFSNDQKFIHRSVSPEYRKLSEINSNWNGLSQTFDQNGKSEYFSLDL